jgi:divalent metal cation (Fe/Co/Zn/Cd) transporter
MILNGVALVEVIKQFMQNLGDTGSLLDVFNKTKDPSMHLLFAQNLLDILGEGLALAAILLRQVTGNAVIDGAASIVVGILLVASAAWQAGRIKNLLIGQSADDFIVQGIGDLIRRQTMVSEIVEFRTLLMGPEFVLVSLCVRLADSVHGQDIERTCFYLERQIQSQYPIARQVYVKCVPAEDYRLYHEAQPLWPVKVPILEQAEYRER